MRFLVDVRVLLIVGHGHGPRVLDALSLHELFELLGHEGEEVVALAAELLQDRPGLEDIPVETWLQLLGRAPAELQVKDPRMAATFNIGGPICASVCTVLRAV